MNNTTYASFTERFLAIYFDASLFLFLFLMTPYEHLICHNKVWGITIVLCYSGLLKISYSLLLNYKFGQTFGKKLFNIKIVKDDLSPLDIKHALLREAIWLLHLSLVFYFLYIPSQLISTEDIRNISPFDFEYSLDYYWNGQERILNFIPIPILLTDAISFFINKNKKSIHDWLGGTIVIRTKEPNSYVKVIHYLLIPIILSLIIILQRAPTKQKFSTMYTHEIYTAIYQLNPISLVEILEKEPELVNKKDPMGKTLLHHLSEVRYRSENRDSSEKNILAEILLAFLLEINEKDIAGNSALHSAIATTFTWDCPYYEFLIKNGANIDLTNREGLIPTQAFYSKLNLPERFLLNRNHYDILESCERERRITPEARDEIQKLLKGDFKKQQKN